MLQLTDRNFILSQEGFFVPLKTHTYKVTEPPVEPGVFEIQTKNRAAHLFLISGAVSRPLPVYFLNIFLIVSMKLFCSGFTFSPLSSPNSFRISFCLAESFCGVSTLTRTS